MLTNIRIENFKSWKDTGDIELAPITILFGSNSSGKSSIQQFLLMLRQTVESNDRKRVLHYGDENTPVELGDYLEIVHSGSPEDPLSFSIEWTNSEEVVVEVDGDEFNIGKQMSFDCTIMGSDDRPPRVYVKNFEYGTAISNDEWLYLNCEKKSDKGKWQYELSADGYSLERSQGRVWGLSSPSQFHGFPDEVYTRYTNVNFAADLTLLLEQQLLSLNYLGPLREKPNRLYKWSGEEVGHVGWRGERTIEALLAGEARSYNTLPKQRRKPLQVMVADWLKKLGVIDSFRVVPIGEGRNEYELKVRAPKSSREVLLTDVGFGVSQVLPVVVECFYSAPGSTLLMEQPEIHLHPSVQSSLADLFIDAIRAREGGTGRNLQLIIESHSEHLLRRFLRRIAEGELDPKNLKCYVVNPGKSGSQIVPLEVDELGNVHNWPENFFGDPTEDLIAQSRSARQRRKEMIAREAEEN